MYLDQDDVPLLVQKATLDWSNIVHMVLHSGEHLALSLAFIEDVLALSAAEIKGTYANDKHYFNLMLEPVVLHYFKLTRKVYIK